MQREISKTNSEILLAKLERSYIKQSPNDRIMIKEIDLDL